MGGRAAAAPGAASHASSRAGTLDRQVAYRLRVAQEASFAAFAELAGEAGLRPGRYAVLQAIADSPGITQTALGRAIGRDKTTLTSGLADLERRGLLERRAHPQDRRSRLLHLTAAGRAALGRLAAAAARHDRRIDALLGPEDREVLLRLLGRLAAALGR